jgi:hypothetical protein
VAAGGALGGDHEPGATSDPLSPFPFVMVQRAEHERVHAGAVVRERTARPRRRDQNICLPGGPKRRNVAGRDIRASGVPELVPIELIGAEWIESLADRDDRPLAARIDER